MRWKFTTLLSLLSLTPLASSQIASLFIYGADKQSLVGQIIHSQSSTTTYIIQCATTDSSALSATAVASASGTMSSDPSSSTDDPLTDDGYGPSDDDDECGFPLPFEFTDAPNSVAYSITLPGVSASIGCALGGTTIATCEEIISGESADFPGRHKVTLGSSDITLIPVPLRTGLTLVDLVTNSDGTFTTTPAAKGSGGAKQTSSPVTNSGGSTTVATSGSTGASSRASASSVATGGGMPMVTAAPQWITGGAAVAMAVLGLSIGQRW